MSVKRIVRWMWLPTVIIIGYTAFVMGTRWQSSRSIENQQRQREAASDRAIVQKYGDGELKLLTFYANPGNISAGGKSLLCYGVANAESVTIEPSVPDANPSLSRCLEVRPTRTTTYTLTAAGRTGSPVSGTATITVR